MIGRYHESAPPELPRRAPGQPTEAPHLPAAPRHAAEHVAVRAELAALTQHVPGIQGCVIAGVDGLLITHDIAGREPHDLAALAATTFGIGRQAGLALGHGPFLESTMRCPGGTFTVYTLTEAAVLAVFGNERLDPDHLHPVARQSVRRLAGMLPDSPTDL